MNGRLVRRELLGCRHELCYRACWLACWLSSIVGNDLPIPPLPFTTNPHPANLISFPWHSMYLEYYGVLHWHVHVPYNVIHTSISPISPISTLEYPPHVFYVSSAIPATPHCIPSSLIFEGHFHGPITLLCALTAARHKQAQTLSVNST